jgi:hypothetical protein
VMAARREAQNRPAGSVARRTSSPRPMR